MTGIGFAKKSDFTAVRKECETPAPDNYKVHIKQSMSNIVEKRNRNSKHHSFMAKWSE